MAPILTGVKRRGGRLRRGGEVRGRSMTRPARSTGARPLAGQEYRGTGPPGVWSMDLRRTP